MEVKKYILDAKWADPEISHMKPNFVRCEPFLDQTPETGGIRKSQSDFTQRHYIEMWVESIMQYLGQDQVTGSSWVVGGDGCAYFQEAFFRVVTVIGSHPGLKKIIIPSDECLFWNEYVGIIIFTHVAKPREQSIAVNNDQFSLEGRTRFYLQVKNIITAKDGLLTFAAMNLMIRKNKALGGILISSRTYESAMKEFLSMKFLISSGRVATGRMLDGIYECSKRLKGYNGVYYMKFPLNEILSYGYIVSNHHITVTVCDATKLYGDYMESIFDFKTIRKLLTSYGLQNNGFRILIDCKDSNGGPFAVEVFEKRLGCEEGCVINEKCELNSGEADFSITDFKTLLNHLKSGKYDVGIAIGSNGEKVMILGRKGIHVCAGDSLAILAAHLHCIPYFQMRGITGIARTLPTSAAVDRVARDLDIPLYEIPVGIKHICNLIEADLISLYGNESYGMGSAHLMQRDGIWGALAWLSVLQHMKMPIHELLYYHWKKYGRTFTIRMDYEGVDENVSVALMNAMENTVVDPKFFGSTLGEDPFKYVVHMSENYLYEDPTGKEYTTKSGVKIVFNCESRIICRVSHITSNVFRLYLEHFSQDRDTFCLAPIVMTKSLFEIASRLTKLEKYIGPVEPTKIF